MEHQSVLEAFLGAVQPRTIKREVIQNELRETQQWLSQGGGLSAVKLFLLLQQVDALGELDDLETLMSHLRYSQSLCNKATAHLVRIGRQELIPLIQNNTVGDHKIGNHSGHIHNASII